MNIHGYELDCFANKEGSIHSGIELPPDRQQRNVYLRLLHME